MERPRKVPCLTKLSCECEASSAHCLRPSGVDTQVAPGQTDARSSCHAYGACHSGKRERQDSGYGALAEFSARFRSHIVGGSSDLEQELMLLWLKTDFLCRRRTEAEKQAELVAKFGEYLKPACQYGHSFLLIIIHVYRNSI